jgi:poly-gamma-glutamate synthesis protein (capsule biosynthesis protein)
MTGRGIDQVLPHPCSPELYEPYVRSAREYVRLAELAQGPMSVPVDFSYVWGDAIAEWERQRPAARIINLETAVTTSDQPAAGKGIHYRMSPRNVACLTAARFDVCGLANNHVLDWGPVGLSETLATLRGAGIGTAGAGTDLAEATAPAVVALPGGGRILVCAFAFESSGVPPEWAAAADRPGVNLLGGLSAANADAVTELAGAHRQRGDVVVFSLHWGGNWDYQITDDERAFAHRLIDSGVVDLVHGHSSHHAKGIEVYRNKLILYGAGDFLNDYEGIGGYEDFRGDLALMYFPTVDSDTGQLRRLLMTPTTVRRFRVSRVAPADVAWLEATLNRETRKLGSGVEPLDDTRLMLRW